jgi:hypothetical protein
VGPEAQGQHSRLWDIGDIVKLIEEWEAKDAEEHCSV